MNAPNVQVTTGGQELPVILDQKDVASLLKISRRQVADLTRAGKLPHIKLSQKVYRYRRDDILTIS